MRSAASGRSPGRCQSWHAWRSRSSTSRNPRVSDCEVAEATLYLKGVTLRARDASPEMLHSINLMVDELARQVKRHREKLRRRREAHARRRRG